MKKKSIQRGAHAATFLAVVWTLFSAFGVFDWLDMHRQWGDPSAIPDLVIWGIHGLLIGIAIYAWKTEKARETLWIGEDDEILDIRPEDIDLEEEKAKLRALIGSQVVGTLWIIGAAWAFIYFSTPTPGAMGIVTLICFFGGILLLNIIFGVIRYVILWYRAKASLPRG